MLYLQILLTIIFLFICAVFFATKTGMNKWNSEYEKDKKEYAKYRKRVLYLLEKKLK